MTDTPMTKTRKSPSCPGGKEAAVMECAKLMNPATPGQMPEWSGRHVVVVGLGVSGLCAVRWLAQQGARVTISDVRPESALPEERVLEARGLGAELQCGGHGAEAFGQAEAIVLSPGVPHDLPPLAEARERGIAVLGELELASRHTRTPIIAVTGTNGKSTVTDMLGFVLRTAGREVFVGGNLGTPLIAYAAGRQAADWVVAEVSSFQLDTIESFRPRVAVILNITPDHLDRYPDFQAYVGSKLRIFENQGPGDVVVLNDEDPALSALRPAGGVSALRYGLAARPGLQAFAANGRAEVRLPGRPARTFPLAEFRLPGRHNRENLLAVALVALWLELDPDSLREAIRTYSGLPHRLEWVAERGGVRFFDDSKATNVDAAVKALESFKEPIVLIAGGRHKGSDYGPLVAAARGRVKRVIVLGEAAGLLAEAFGGVIPVAEAENLETAVAKSFGSAAPGEVVLLAPACSSFDMFIDYAHRGRVFRAAVEGLADG